MERFVAPDGIQLAFQYDDFTDPGSDTPYVLLHHGFPRNSNFWRTWVPHLGRHMRVIRPDLRGLGQSQVPLDTYEPSLNLFVEDACALLDHLRVPKVVWIGHATGNLVGLTLAAKYPERVRALVLCDSLSWVDGTNLNKVAGKEKKGDAVWFGPGAENTFVKYGMREYARYFMRNAPLFQSLPQGYLNWYEEQVAITDAHRAHKFYQALLEVDCRPLLENITAPTLLINGRQDGAASRDDQKYIIEHISDAREVVFEGSGYALYYCRPDECAREAKRFLASCNILPSDAVGTP